MKLETKTARQVWIWPVVLAVLSLLGLIVGLLGQGWLDLISWASLGLLVAVCAYAFKH